jgi:anti-sigma-K factor RskA
MTHAEFQDLCPAYALGALDSEERSSLEAHLAECAGCRRLVAEHAEASAGLAAALPPESPDSAMRDRILASVRRDPGRAPLPGSGGGAFPGWALPLVAAAALLLGVWMGGQFSATTGNAELEKLRKDAREARERFAQSELARAEIAQTLARSEQFAATCRKLALRGTPDMAPAAGAIVMWQGKELELVAAGLPQPPAGREYELWAIVGGKPVRAGQAMPDADGHLSIAHTFGAPMEQVESFAITDEPTGGVDAPTGRLYLVAAK